MKREELLKSKEYWMVQIQNDLYGIIEDYKKEKGFNQTELSKNFEVSKGYISQVLNGTYDHKISKLVDLALRCNRFPLLSFINADEFIANDAKGKYYDLIPVARPVQVSYETGVYTGEPLEIPRIKYDTFITEENFSIGQSKLETSMASFVVIKGGNYNLKTG